MSLANEIRAVERRTAKQILLDLYGKRLIGPLQLRGLARALDALIETGMAQHDALKFCLGEYEAGRLTATGGKVKQLQRVTYDQAPAGLTPKAALVWLHDQGSVSHAQLRQLAGAVDEAVADRVKQPLLAAIVAVGLLQLVPTAERTKLIERTKLEEQEQKVEQEVQAATFENPLASIVFASDPAAELAAAKALIPADFLGEIADSPRGYTIDDVRKVVAKVS